MVPSQIWEKNMVEKKLIRKEIFRRRKEASQEELDIWSDAIIEKVLATDMYKNCETIYTYVAYKREVETKGLIQQAWKDGKKVAVPRVEGSVMNFYYITSLDQLENSDMGIPEPKPENPADDEYALMVMPGVAFDRTMNRIGYGGGFYDRYLEEHPNLKRLAIAFEFQFVEGPLPTEPTDICPEMIITESCILTK